jgi:hypothetical protein
MLNELREIYTSLRTSPEAPGIGGQKKILKLGNMLGVLIFYEIYIKLGRK